MNNFFIVCKNCGAEIKLPEDCAQEGAEEGFNENIHWFVSCYETLDIKCKCGNTRS